MVAVVAAFSGCANRPADPTPNTAPSASAPPDQTNATNAIPLGGVSGAGTAREYRRDAATHLYNRNKERIYAGKMPPLLYAVGVLQVHIDARGNVTGLDWMRAPSHAPEVVAEIERSVREAAPYPAPAKMGRVVYTDTWLWEKSGKFQLDTLTEGQL